jgi:hypothetical protein
MIASALSAHAVQPAPLALTATVAAAATNSWAAGSSTLTLIQETLKFMAWTKAKTAIAAGVGIFLALGTGTALVKLASNEKSKQSAAVAIEKVAAANTGLPAAQAEAKMLIFSAMAQRRIPDAANWCETLNAKGKLWPATPTNTTFAMNSQVAGRAYTRKEISSGSLPGKTVVFFETSTAGWNQAGGSELLPTNADSVAVAFADGTALIVTAQDLATLRWMP